MGICRSCDSLMESGTIEAHRILAAGTIAREPHGLFARWSHQVPEAAVQAAEFEVVEVGSLPRPGRLEQFIFLLKWKEGKINLIDVSLLNYLKTMALLALLRIGKAWRAFSVCKSKWTVFLGQMFQDDLLELPDRKDLLELLECLGVNSAPRFSRKCEFLS